MGDMWQCLKAVVERRKELRSYRTTPLEKRLEGCRDTMEMIKPNESWEGKWNEHVGG